MFLTLFGNYKVYFSVHILGVMTSMSLNFLHWIMQLSDYTYSRYLANVELALYFVKIKISTHFEIKY